AYTLYTYLLLLPVVIMMRKPLGYMTVAVRYLYDLIAGSWGNGMKVPLENLLLRMVPRPDVSFVFDADVKRILTDRPEHTFEYIINEKAQYSKLVGAFGLRRVSTDDHPESVWTSILHDIKARFPQGDQERRPDLRA